MRAEELREASGRFHLLAGDTPMFRGGLDL
jgi:hypothetical protein